MEIELCGYKVLIDDEDYEKIIKHGWYTENLKYRKSGNLYFAHKIYYNNKKRYTLELHRFILGLERGDGIVCDHVNGNTLDNRKCNLRKCTHAENLRNQKLSKRNTIGYKGVYREKGINKYYSKIAIDKKDIYLGSFNTPQEAHYAYCEASKKYHGEFGRTE